MARKVIIDCDPGIDDALALAIALFDPRLEVIAVTACAGIVDAEQSSENVQILMEKLDPPKIPRIGKACDPDQGAAVANGAILHGEDGLGDMGWTSASRQHAMLSDKLIEREIRANPDQVTLVCSGPLTGVGRALARDPSLAEEVDRIMIVGGSVTLEGNETATAEFNMHFDPQSAQQVFRSATTKSLIPLEISEQLRFGWELVEQLPPTYSKVGDVLSKIVPSLFRATRQQLGKETISLQSVLPILALLEPMLFEWETMAGDIECQGQLTRGATVFDRRLPREWRLNMEVATKLDVAAAKDAFFNSLKYAAQNF